MPYKQPGLKHIGTKKIAEMRVIPARLAVLALDNDMPLMISRCQLHPSIHRCCMSHTCTKTPVSIADHFAHVPYCVGACLRNSWKVDKYLCTLLVPLKGASL